MRWPPAVHAGSMTDNEKAPMFTDRLRQQLLLQRVVVLDGPLDDDNGAVLTVQLLMLAAEDARADIGFWIHSPGGSVPSMLAIRDVMRLVPCDVSTLALGLACSAGQFLLSAGTRGKRLALPHARILMHQPLGGITGGAADIAIQAEQFAVIKKEMFRLNAEFTGQPIERIEADSDRDRWFTAQEALEYGFVDHIITSANTNGVAP